MLFVGYISPRKSDKLLKNHKSDSLFLFEHLRLRKNVFPIKFLEKSFLIFIYILKGIASICNFKKLSIFYS